MQAGDAIAAVVVLAVMAATLFLLSQPFWPGHEERAADRDALQRADLEAAKVAKYREIRDAELDHQTGKLSEEDWRPIDRRLRAEAVAILDQLERLGATRDAGEPSASAGTGRGTGSSLDPGADARL